MPQKKRIDLASVKRAFFDRAKVLAISSAICLVVSLLVIRMSFSPPPLLKDAMYSIYDRLFTLIGGDLASNVPIIIDIDEKSLRELGQWSWPRSITARIFDRLADGGVLAIGADYLPAEPDRTSPARWAETFSSVSGVSVDLSSIPDEWMDLDTIFADALKRTPTVIGAELTSDARDRGRAFVQSYPIREVRDIGALPLVEYLEEYEGIISPIPTVTYAVQCCGLLNIEPSGDGLYRAIPAFLEFNGRVIVSLMLATLATAHGDSEIVVRVGVDGPISVRAAGAEIPVDKNGYMLVSFAEGAKPYVRYSASDVYFGRVSRKALEGKIAFFGSTAFGLSDLRPTPMDPYCTSIEFDAAAADTILSRRFIRFPRNNDMINTIAILAIAVLCVLLFTFASPLTACGAATIAALSLMCAYAWLYVEHGLIMQPLFMEIALVLCSVISFSVRYHSEKGERLLLRRAFSNYVSPEVVSRIVEAGDVSHLAGETRNVTVLFTDVRNFTSISEAMDPNSVVELLDSYFTPMTRIVRATEGTVDKFIGDALMAFWNAPLDVADHERHALRAYMQMRTALDALEPELEERFGTRLRFGAGICTGPAHVGNMGTSELVSYTALGDTVNAASRLEGMTKKYGVDVVLGESTAVRCAGEWHMRKIDVVRLKGKSVATPIYTAHDNALAASRADEFAKWTDALDAYVAGDFAFASSAIGDLRRAYPNEYLYGVFASRIEKMNGTPPTDWDGVFTHEEK